jgi:hypothetical protein
MSISDILVYADRRRPLVNASNSPFASHTASGFI